jgi:membrane-associated progesterone receptor component
VYDGTDPSNTILHLHTRQGLLCLLRPQLLRARCYAIFAGNEASRSLSMMSKDEADVSDDLSGLTEKELSVIAD